MLISPNFRTMANRMQAMDSDLKECYNHELDWSLLPEKLRQVRHKIPFCFASLSSTKKKVFAITYFCPVTPNYRHVLTQFLSLSFVDLSFIRKRDEATRNDRIIGNTDINIIFYNIDRTLRALLLVKNPCFIKV